MPVTTLDPKTALVVIDLQNAVAALPGEPHSTADVIERTAELVDAFHKRNLPVVLVRVSFSADGSDRPTGRTEQQMSSTATPPANGSEIVDRLAGHSDDIIVTKRNWGAFHGTDLDVHLRRRGITQIVLTGVATSIGVESTARAAFEHGYHVTLATDAMTDLSADSHEHSLTRIFPRLGETGATADIINLLG
ncbi:isochorismatase family protein [Kribbella sp. NPDC055071]